MHFTQRKAFASQPVEHRMQWIRSNVVALVMSIASVAFVGVGCGLIPTDFLPGPRTSEAQTSSNPTIAAHQRAAQVASTVGDVAGTVSQFPTPAAPIAAGVSNFADGYSAELLTRLDRIDQRIAAGEQVGKGELTQTHIAAFLAGLSALFFKTRKGQQLTQS